MMNKKTSSVFPLYYAPPISYYIHLIQFDTVIFDIHQNYIKQNYFNRIHLLKSSGILKLTIPVNKFNNHTSLKEIIISYDTNWQKNHWHSIQTTYKSSPFFEYYDYILYPHYHTTYENLIEFNIAIHKSIMKCLRIKLKFKFSESFVESSKNDFRNEFHPKKKHVTEKLLIPYQQVFSYNNPFVANLSIFDLIFNLGNESLSYLYKMIKIIN